jgi:hypothetical protein
MKTTKLQLIVLLCFANIALFAQNAERFIGTFHIVGECTDLNHENNIFDENRDIIIILSAGNESGLLLEMQPFSSKSHLQVFIHNDSIFIPLQPFENFDGTQAFFSGEGKVINDSIFFHYHAGGTFGSFECNVKGKKMTTNAEFAPIGAEWYYTYTFGCCPEEHFNHVVSEKDTIVEETSCRVLRQYYDNSNTASETYIIRQEQGKVYYYYQDRFNLFIDFGVQVDDTVTFSFIYKYSNYSLPLKDTIVSARFHVEDITTNAQNLKTFRAKVLEEDVHKLCEVFNYFDYLSHYTYTEKIGLHGEFMPVFGNAPHPDEDVCRWLRCYSGANFSFMSDEWSAISLPCDYFIAIATDIDIPPNENIKIYPNPFNNNLFVFANNGKNINIVDVAGKVVYYSELSNGINEISTGHFSTGIYFVKISNKDNSTQTFKMVKL